MKTTFTDYIDIRRKATIYIVDDDPKVLKSLAQSVKPTKIRTKTFSRVVDFLDFYSADGPGCLVFNMWMPGMSGGELQSLLAKEDVKVPIIFIADHADVRMAVSAIKAGAANFFEKPFRPQEILEEIHKAIRADIETWKHRYEEQKNESRLAQLKMGERKVIELVMEGKTNKDIAKLLQLSVRGVEARRAKAKKILQVGSKGELLQLLRTTARKTTPRGRTITSGRVSTSKKKDRGEMRTTHPRGDKRTKGRFRPSKNMNHAPAAARA